MVKRWIAVILCIAMLILSGCCAVPLQGIPSAGSGNQGAPGSTAIKDIEENTPEQAENFDEVFGTNTGYVIDPEECMADNFAYTMVYGMDGPDGAGFPSPEIPEGIISYLSR